MKVRIPVKEITDICTQILLKAGINKEDTIIIIDHLLEGELSGHPSHGFYRIPGIVSTVTKIDKTFDITCEKETDCAVLLNGGKRVGLVVALKAMDVLINKTRQTEVVIVGGHNYVGTTGSMGYFTRKIANAGFIGMMFANSASSIPPWGGLTPIFGTNPISISFPTVSEPIVVDLATSKWAYGDIALAIKEGRRIPEGIVLDQFGNPSTDPNDADYVMLPFGEHKGYALALAVEILAGSLVKAKMGESVDGSDGFTMISINPGVFRSAEEFRNDVSRLIMEIKSSKRMNGVDELFYPGERSQRTRYQNNQADYIEMVDVILNDKKSLLNDMNNVDGDYC